jgi:hypothetical protein
MIVQKRRVFVSYASPGRCRGKALLHKMNFAAGG